MKQKYLILLLLFFSALTLAAQQFQGGIAAGLVGSQVAGDTYSGYHKPGAYSAIWIRLDLSERISLQTELSYFQKGSRHNPDEKRNDLTFYLMRLGYIEMPFLYQYHLKKNIILEAGPSLSFLLHSYEELDYNTVSYGKFTVFNPSLMAGIGYPISSRLSAHFRMNSSILSIRRDKVNGARSRLFDQGQYNDTILFFLSYKLQPKT
jgi:hypothetical protein